MALLEIVYASRASVPFSRQDLETLLLKARARNALVEVTGILLHHEASFFQVLEGPEEGVVSTYERIAKDTRHGSVLLLSRREVVSREFGAWAMGFAASASESERLARRMEGFTKYLATGHVEHSHEVGGRMKPILDKFRQGGLRR